MEQQLYAICLTESIDMGIRSNSAEQKAFPLSEIKKGAKLTISESWGQPNPDDANDTVHIAWELTVDELTDEKLKFTFMGDHFTLNRHWQVLGTGTHSVPNAYIHIYMRFVFYFGTEQKNEESQFDRFQELYDQMNANKKVGNFWKNIPLAQEALHFMKDIAPNEDRDLFKQFCEMVVDEELLQNIDTPRLLLSFMDLWHVLNKSTYKWEQKTNRLLRMTDPNVTEYEKLKMIEEVRMLKYDPIQLSEPWEENIYEVEKELDELFKDEPRYMGFCFSYWSAKRAAMAKRGIMWRSPQAMNPGTIFD